MEVGSVAKGIGTIIGVFSLLGLSFAFFGYAWRSFRKGSQEKMQEEIDMDKYFKDKIGSLNTILEDYEKRFKSMEERILTLELENKAKDQIILNYQSIFQGRNPENEKYMAHLMEVATKSVSFMDDIKSNIDRHTSMLTILVDQKKQLSH